MVAPNPSVAFQWDSLPSHLQELILAHLPVSEQSRLRSVNRAWLTIFTSTYFRELHRRLHPRIRPTFLVYNHAVKISALVWPHPEDEVAAPSWQDLSLPAPFVREWVGGARSLVCVRNHLSSSGFSVGCPYTNQWKTLPNPPRGPVLSKLWAMVPHTFTNAASVQYSVILLQLSTPSLHIDVYDSEKNLWLQRTVPKGNGAGKGHLVSFSSMASCVGGLVYSVQAESRSIVTYDVQSDVWKTMEAKFPENLVFQAPTQGGIIQAIPQVMQGCKGKILLVGAAEYASGIDTVCGGGDDDKEYCVDAGADCAINDTIDDTEGRNNVNYAVIVWELDWATKQWREMARAPSHMWMHMLEEAMESCKAAVTPVKLSGHGEVVVVMAAGSQRALQFDALEEKWAWLDLPPAVNCDLSLCLDPKSVEIF